jgi:hemoglobin-like flavoprotein
MIDKTVNMLGVDNEELSKTLLGLGKMHVTYGVKPEYFPMMTEAVVLMLKDLLGDSWKYSDGGAWNSVLGSLIAGMVKGQRKLDKGLAGANKSAVITNWRQLMTIQNYQERAGVVIFRQ